MRVRVLYLGTEEGLAEDVQAALKRSRIHTKMTAVRTVAEFRRCLQSEAFDCIFADDDAGVNVLRTLRAAQRLQPHTPAIVLSHDLRDEVVVRAIRAGASDCVCKQNLAKISVAARRALRAAERKRKLHEAEDALRQSEQRYRAFISNSSEAIWRVDLDKPMPVDLPEDEQVEWYYRYGYIAECNDAMAAMYGYERAGSMVGLRVDSVMPRNEQNIAQIRAAIQAGYRLSDIESIEWDRYGKLRNILNNVIGEVQDGMLLRVWGTQRDITELRRTEQRIREGRARLRAILDSAIDAIVTIDSHGAIVDFNPAAEHVFGHRRDDVVGKSAVDVLVPVHLRQRLQAELARFLETGESAAIGRHVELPGLRADGSEFPAEFAITVTGFPGPSPLATIFVRDITERAEAQSQLQRQLYERQSICELSEAVAQAYDVDDVCSIALDALLRLIRADRAAVLLLDRDGYMRFIAWRGLSDEYRTAMEGRVRWSADRTDSSPMLISDVREENAFADAQELLLREGIHALALIPLVYKARLLGKFMIYFDHPHAFCEKEEVRLAQLISNHVVFAIESRRRQQANEEQRSFLKAVLDVNPNLIFAKDREGRFTLANLAVAEIYGTTPDELLGKTDADFNPNAEEVAWFRERDLEVMDTQSEQVMEEVVTDSTGRKHWLHTVKRPIPGGNGRAEQVLGVAVDITERKVSEAELRRHREHLEELVAERTREVETSHQQLRQSERMAMIGTLSTGLGHDMGNLLLPLRVRLDAMEARGLPEEFGEDVRAIRTFAEYLQRLSSGLRLLALDPQDAGHESTDIYEWWPDVQPVLKNALPSGVTLDVNFAKDLPRVGMARHVLTQAVFNLVQNAGEAIRDQGRGRVTVWAEPGDEHTVRLGVTDDGPGMTQEALRRCMEPFYTTKTRGISTGLGLALVHGLVQQAGGTIKVESQLGRGTTFTFILPAEHLRDGDFGFADHSPRASIAVQDARVRSHIASVFRALGFEVEVESSLEMPGAEVWVVDATPRALRRAREFASGSEHRHAIAVGTVPRGEDFMRLNQLPSSPKPSDIWRLVRSIAERFELARKDAE